MSVIMDELTQQLAHTAPLTDGARDPRWVCRCMHELVRCVVHMNGCIVGCAGLLSSRGAASPSTTSEHDGSRCWPCRSSRRCDCCRLCRANDDTLYV